MATAARADLLAVGLGNPGGDYAGTRHNAGRWAIDELVGRHDVALRPIRGVPARTAELVLDGRRAVVAATTVYMNESGRAVAELVRRCRVDGLERIVVVHDELDLPVGRIKVKAGGGMAGHRGLKSIRDRLGSGDFTRVRIGIGRPRRRQRPGGAVAAEPADVVDYVLSRPGAADMAALSRAVTRAADAVECLAASGTGRAMELFNSARAL